MSGTSSPAGVLPPLGGSSPRRCRRPAWCRRTRPSVPGVAARTRRRRRVVVVIAAARRRDHAQRRGPDAVRLLNRYIFQSPMVDRWRAPRRPAAESMGPLRTRARWDGDRPRRPAPETERTRHHGRSGAPCPLLKRLAGHEHRLMVTSMSNRARVHELVGPKRPGDGGWCTSPVGVTASRASAAKPTTMRRWHHASGPPRPRPVRASGSGGRTRSARPTTARAPTSRCSRASPRASSCACSAPSSDAGEVRVELREVDGHCWHAYLPDVRPGQRYGYRVHGPWDPASGLWCNPSKLLLDPYAKAIDGEVDWDPACFAYDFDDPDEMNTDDSAPHVPRGVVADPFFDWGNDRPPEHGMHDTVDLRGPRQGPHAAPPGGARGDARHVLGPRPPGRRRAPRRRSASRPSS